LGAIKICPAHNGYGQIKSSCYYGLWWHHCWWSLQRKELNIVSAFEALGEKIQNKLSDEDYKGIIQNSCPGLAHAVACIQQTPWLRPLKRLVCHCLIPHLIPR
jgi:hypothetical protein